MTTLSILAACTLVVVLATLLPVVRHPHWMVRGLDFPRVQIALLASVLLIAQLVLLDYDAVVSWLLVAATLVCLAWQGWWILPYSRLWPCEVKAARHEDSERRLSIINANVLTPNRNAGALIERVRRFQPDILVTLESDQWWEDQLRVVEEDMPHCIRCPLDNLYGMHVYSRLPFEDEEIAYLVEADVPSIHLSLTLRSGDKVRMHFVHPTPPSPTENPESAERDAELIIVARSVAESDQPVVVSGDLNDVAWSATTRLFRKISGLLDPRVGRGMFNTFHADYPFLRWPLDHLFHSEHFTLQHIQRLPSIGSDHFPLYTALVLAPVSGAGQDTPDEEPEDVERAREITAQEGVSMSDVPEPNE